MIRLIKKSILFYKQFMAKSIESGGASDSSVETQESPETQKLLEAQELTERPIFKLIESRNTSKSFEMLFNPPGANHLEIILKSIYEKEWLWENERSIISKDAIDSLMISSLLNKLKFDSWLDFSSSEIWKNFQIFFNWLKNKEVTDEMYEDLENFIHKLLKEEFSRVKLLLDYSRNQKASELFDNILDIGKSTMGVVADVWKKVWIIVPWIKEEKDTTPKWSETNTKKLLNLFNNPLALNELITNWQLNKDWYKINFKDSKLEVSSLWEFSNLEQEKERFMTDTIKTFNKLWRNIDSINPENIWEALDFIGFGSEEDIDKFLETIKSPSLRAVIWFFLKTAMWMLSMKWIDSITLNDNIKKSINNLDSYQKDPKLETPYNSSEQFSEWDIWNLKVFLNWISSLEKRESEWKTNINSIISNKDFWKNIFLNEVIPWEDNDLIERIRQEVQKINPDNKNMTQENFLKELAKVKIPEKVVEKPLNAVRLEEVNKIRENSFEIRWKSYKAEILKDGKNILKKIEFNEDWAILHIADLPYKIESLVLLEYIQELVDKWTFETNKLWITLLINEISN